MKRREFLKAMGLGSVTAIPWSVFAADASRKPNIVFIMADDHALEAISCYGSSLKDYAKTPNIDRVAKEGMRFNNVCCNNSICSPSRASILTGQYSHKNGVRRLNGTIVEGAPWFSAELQKAGYQTAVFGKWHLRNTPNGFDDYAVTRGQGSYFNPTFYTPKGVTKYKGYATDVYTDVALEWLRKRDRENPFCLLLHFKAPHHPYDYPQRHEGMFKKVKIPEPFNLYEDLEKTSPKFKAMLWSQMGKQNSYYSRHKDELEPHDENSHESRVAAAYQHMLKKYIRCVTANDENVARVLDYLDEEELVENTIVIYTSDQGYWLGQHGLYDKRLILEESLKMPFLVRYPQAIAAGTVCHKLCSNVDFAPTFLDFAGAPIAAKMQGRSVRPLMQGEVPEDWPTSLFYCYWGGPPTHYGVRTERYKLIHLAGTDEIEFYDLQGDPMEMVNQAANPEYAEAIAMCEKELDRLMKEVDIKPSELPEKAKRRAPRRRRLE